MTLATTVLAERTPAECSDRNQELVILHTICQMGYDDDKGTKCVHKHCNNSALVVQSHLMNFEKNIKICQSLMNKDKSKLAVTVIDLRLHIQLTIICASRTGSLLTTKVLLR